MRKVFFLFLSISTLFFVSAQQDSQKQKVEYVHSFARNIEWPGAKDFYTIRVITQDRVLTSEFETLAASKKLKNKPIKVSSSSYVSIPDDVDILYVSSLYNGALQTIIDRIVGKPILIITEESPDQQYVMVNFVKSGSGAIAFEYNRANISNQNLKILPEFSLLGGSEIDVAKLYRQARDSARVMEQRSQVVKERIDSLNLQAAIALRIANNQMRQIDEQTQEIERRKIELQRQGQVLDSLTIEFKNSQAKLDQLTNVLHEREEQLEVLGGEIAQQEKSIDEGNKTLKEQEGLIAQRNREIAEREASLKKLGTVVDAQEDTLLLLILFSVFLVVVLIFAYRAYQARRRDAKKLNEQKQELRGLLDELQSTQTQLVQSEKMASLGVLTAGIAHEINNAINYVYSGIHVLNSKFSEIKPVLNIFNGLNGDVKDLKARIQKLEEIKKEIDYDESEGVIDTMIRSIKVGAERTTEIVKGLRTFSREESETMQEIDIHQDIDVALLLLKNRHKNNVTIEQKLADSLPPVFGYPGQVGQAILNIISNAIDAVSAKGKDAVIVIATSFTNNKIVISIRDNGTGINPGDVDKIFDPFFTTKKIGEGTGLGLSITYGIIEKHKGTIDVDSTPGEGTEFKIKLPLNDQPRN